MESIRYDLLHAARVLAAANCLPAADGNFSARLPNDQALVTRKGIEKRDLQAADLLIVDLPDPHPEGASTEWGLHRALYLNRPACAAILHVHAPYLSAFCAVAKLPDTGLLIEASLTLGGLALIPYVAPGTVELGEAAVRHGGEACVLLLERHGVVALGNSVHEALHRLERAELLAQTDLLSRLLKS